MDVKLNIVIPPRLDELPTNVTPHPYYRLQSVLHQNGSTTIFHGIWEGPDFHDLVQEGSSIIVKRYNKITPETNNEINMLYRLMSKTNPHQDFFMKLIHVYDVVPAKICDLVFQDGGMDLFEDATIHKEENLSARIKRLSLIMSHVVMCLVKLHSLKLVHNDIKPENIVRSSSSPHNVNFIDFGIATIAHHVISPSSSKKEKIGSEMYMHPHLLWDLELDLYHNDLWAVGITCLTLYASCNLFSKTALTSRKNRTLKTMLCDPEWFKSLEYLFSQELRDHESFGAFCQFVTRMCNETQRPTSCADMLLLQEPFLCYWRVDSETTDSK